MCQVMHTRYLLQSHDLEIEFTSHSTQKETEDQKGYEMCPGHTGLGTGHFAWLQTHVYDHSLRELK